MSNEPYPGSTESAADDGPLDEPYDGSLRVVTSEVFDVEPPYATEIDALDTGEFDDRFLDRELSWLRFNLRLLEMAEDVSLPLLERVRSIAFFASNLDEFFMVRVAGLKRRIAAGMAVRAASGMMPRDVLEAIWTRAAEQSLRHAEFFRDDGGSRTGVSDAFYEMTLGLVYRPRDWFWVRPEVPGDWAASRHPYNEGRSGAQLTFGFDTILLF
jgi:polyphosphate kinase